MRLNPPTIVIFLISFVLASLAIITKLGSFPFRATSRIRVLAVDHGLLHADGRQSRAGALSRSRAQVGARSAPAPSAWAPHWRRVASMRSMASAMTIPDCFAAVELVRPAEHKLRGAGGEVGEHTGSTCTLEGHQLSIIALSPSSPPLAAAPAIIA